MMVITWRGAYTRVSIWYGTYTLVATLENAFTRVCIWGGSYMNVFIWEEACLRVFLSTQMSQFDDRGHSVLRW